MFFCLFLHHSNKHLPNLPLIYLDNKMRAGCLQLLFLSAWEVISNSRISLGDLLVLSFHEMEALFFKNTSQGFLISNFKKCHFLFCTNVSQIKLLHSCWVSSFSNCIYSQISLAFQSGTRNKSKQTKKKSNPTNTMHTLMKPPECFNIIQGNFLQETKWMKFAYGPLSFANPSTRTREICGWKPVGSQMC